MTPFSNAECSAFSNRIGFKIQWSKYLIGRNFIGGKFHRQKIFVGKNFCHLLKILSLFTDEYFSDDVSSNFQVFREIKAGNTVKHQQIEQLFHFL